MHFSSRHLKLRGTWSISSELLDAISFYKLQSHTPLSP